MSRARPLRVSVRAFLHMIWTTWERAPLITDEIEPALYEILRKRATLLQCDVLAVGGDATHVHVVVVMHPMASIGQLAKHLKGGSSFQLNHEVVRGGGFRWNATYCARTISPNSLELVMQYVNSHRDRRTKHERPPREREGRRVSL